MAEITAEYLRSILHYEPETGVFTWLERPREHFKNNSAHKGWNTKYTGSIAGTVTVAGYIHIGIDGIIYGAHRLVWLYMTGLLPTLEIDHINCIKTDNRLTNLRLANRMQNSYNRKIPSNNTSGIKGVRWSEDVKKWRVQIDANGKRHYVGFFSTMDEAKAAREQAINDMHGRFARLA